MSRGPGTSKLVALALAFSMVGVVLAFVLRRRAEPAAASPSPASSAQLHEAEDALRRAIEARVEPEKVRALALSTAHRTLAPTGPPGSCDRALTTMSQAELLSLVAITDLEHAPRWSGPRVRLLEGALASLERSRRDPTRSARAPSPELAANARALAALPETRFDFQLVIDESLAPVVTGNDFSPGYQKGTLWAYDREAQAVVCGARAAGANRGDALGRLRPRGGFAPELWTEQDSVALLEDDLRTTTLLGAAEKLVSPSAKAR